MPSISYSDAMNDALERMDDLGYERGVGVDLANHGPMGAEALCVLGHGDEVARWVEDYRVSTPHHEVPAARFALDPADEADWRSALGTFGRAGDWERLFERELAESPWRDVLARWWPRLLPGLLAGLTHGVIRTAHAVRNLYGSPRPNARQLTELARGLAYWAAKYQGLPGEARLTGTHDFASALAQVPRESVGSAGGPGSVKGRMRVFDVLTDHAGYAAALERLAPDEPTRLLSEMTAEFAGVYIGHPEVPPVPLVHGVTAPAAVRIVLPHLPPGLHEPSVAALWKVHAALLAVLTKDRRGERPEEWRVQEPEAAPTFAELSARAVEHGDEHVVKFTEACAREYALRPDPRYPAAAHAAQRRLPRLATRKAG